MFAAMLFDLDGTLIDSEVLWIEAVGRALQEAGCRPTEQALVDLVYGRAWGDIYQDIVRQYPDAYAGYDALTEIARTHFRGLRQTRDIRIHNSIEVLVQLAASYPIAIVSGSTRNAIAREIEGMGITAHIHFFLGCEDYTPGKPHPACYLLAAERMGVCPEQCLVFEDSAHGVQAAKTAGMTCVALQLAERPAQIFSAADYVVDDLRVCLHNGVLNVR
ncbi:MAG: HAD family hydrolase [Armatimonadota bacterium]